MELALLLLLVSDLAPGYDRTGRRRAPWPRRHPRRRGDAARRTRAGPRLGIQSRRHCRGAGGAGAAAPFLLLAGHLLVDVGMELHALASAAALRYY